MDSRSITAHFAKGVEVSQWAIATFGKSGSAIYKAIGLCEAIIEENLVT